MYGCNCWKELMIGRMIVRNKCLSRIVLEKGCRGLRRSISPWFLGCFAKKDSWKGQTKERRSSEKTNAFHNYSE